MPNSEGAGWNTEIAAKRFAFKPVVLIEWAVRRRVLILPPGNPGQVASLADLAGKRLAKRQQAAGSHVLLKKLMAETDPDLADAVLDGPSVRDERDAAQAVFSGEADVAFGLETAARQSRLDFVPVCTERFDLLVHRRDYFEAAFQKLLKFSRTPEFAAKADQLAGYDISGLGTVHFNGY